jgi:hypothetical protein
LTARPRVVWFPRKIFPHSARLEPLFEAVEEGPVDAILFADERRSAPKDNLRDLMGWLQAPVIDLSGRAAEFADVHFDLAQPDTWDRTAQAVLEFRARRKRLNPAIRDSIEPELQLIAHAFVSARPLAPKRYPQVPEAVCYPGHWSARALVPLAERLVSRGLLRAKFSDRIHECRACSSRRMSAREECPSCRSAHLSEVDLIHHYHCAALLPEERFRRGSHLVCPKCSQQLRNYGKDYDRPGRAFACNDCMKTTSEPEVGFVCLDCSTNCRGEEARTVDVCSYELTDEANRLLTSPAVHDALGDLKAAIRRSRAGGRDPVAVAEIRYESKSEIEGRQGEATFSRLRRLFLENMMGHLAETGEHHAGRTADYLLLFGYDEALATRLKETLDQSDNILATKIHPTIKVISRQGAARL